MVKWVNSKLHNHSKSKNNCVFNQITSIFILYTIYIFVTIITMNRPLSPLATCSNLLIWLTFSGFRILRRIVYLIYTGRLFSFCCQCLVISRLVPFLMYCSLIASFHWFRVCTSGLGIALTVSMPSNSRTKALIFYFVT